MLIHDAAAVAAGALAAGPAAALAARRPAGFGAPVADPNGLLDLPRGFSYRLVQSVEDRLSDGAPVPGCFDGMAAFGAPGGATLLVRNHELNPGRLGERAPVAGASPYDAGAPGGTTAVLVRGDGRAASSFVASSGTIDNCAGGATPWGTWITCEEERTSGHGHCFEVDPASPQDARSRSPILAMGHFSHEAIAIDPRTGIAYLTEDDHATRTSFLYRFRPEDRSRRPGALARGGRLEALAIDRRPAYDADRGRTRDQPRVVWRGVRPEQAHEDAMTHGCARFDRLEGAAFAGGALWFDDTQGGTGSRGRVFRYRPATRRLELFLEGDSAGRMQSPDNLVVTPWGDVWFAEDGAGSQRVVGFTPGGRGYVFARNRLVGRAGAPAATELAGPCFSADGRTLFLNLYDPGHTLAITGPFPRRDAARTAVLAAAPPRHAFAPAVDEALAEAAFRAGLTLHEAAAYRALGAELAA